MGVLGDLLEALYEAPRARSFAGTARRGADMNAMREMMERRNARGGAQSSMLVSSSDGPTGQAPTGVQETAIRFWYAGDDWRVDHDMARLIGHGREMFRFHPGMGGVVSASDARHSAMFEGLGWYLAPAAILGTFRFSDIREVEHLGRPCWHVSTEVVETHPGPNMIHIGGGGEDFELTVDRALGIVVRCAGSFEGMRVSRFDIDELVVDQPIDGEVFAFATPDGSPIRTHGEIQLEHLRQRGVDVSGIDPSDPDQMRDAMIASMPMRGHRGAPDLEQLAAQHFPTGPPPDDEARAIDEITVAFEGIGTRTEDGAGLVNVERGENLGPCVQEVARRFPQFTGDNAQSPRVDKIKFLHAAEAVVWFSAVVQHREGRAVLVDRAWKVSRATYCSLVAMAGVVCPPPPDEEAE